MEELEFIRFFCAFFAGALLALSGSLVQVSTQNELASPSTLGMDAFVVLIYLIVHLFVASDVLGPIFPVSYLTLMVIILTLILFLILKRTQKRIKIYGSKTSNQMNFYLVSGLSFNLFVGAIFSLLHFFFMAQNKSFPAELWYGNFRMVQKTDLLIIGGIFCCVQLRVAFKSKSLWALCFGDDFAQGLNIKVHELRFEALCLALLATGAVSALFGVFVFMGLVFPMLLRTLPVFASNTSRELIWGPFLCGGAFGALDLFCANYPYLGAEIPVGLVSGVLGTTVLVVSLLSRWSKTR